MITIETVASKTVFRRTVTNKYKTAAAPMQKPENRQFGLWIFGRVRVAKSWHQLTDDAYLNRRFVGSRRSSQVEEVWTENPWIMVQNLNRYKDFRWKSKVRWKGRN